MNISCRGGFEGLRQGHGCRIVGHAAAGPYGAGVVVERGTRPAFPTPIQSDLSVDPSIDWSSVYPPTSLSPCLTGTRLPCHLCNSVAFSVVTVVQPHFTTEPLQNLWFGHEFGQNGILSSGLFPVLVQVRRLMNHGGGAGTWGPVRPVLRS